MVHGPCIISALHSAFFFLNLITQWTWYSKSFKAISISQFSLNAMLQMHRYDLCASWAIFRSFRCLDVCVFRLSHFLIPHRLHSDGKCQLKRIGRVVRDAICLRRWTVFLSFSLKTSNGMHLASVTFKRRLYETTEEKDIMHWHCSLKQLNQKQ